MALHTRDEGATLPQKPETVRKKHTTNISKIGAKHPRKVTKAGGEVVLAVARTFKMGDGEVCGAKKKVRKGQQTGYCNLAAGWGTNHPGIGKCKFHGGSTPSHIRNAAKVSYHRLLGEELEIDPLNALLWCIRHAAGEMVFWQAQIDELEKEVWFSDTIAGKTIHHYAREMRAARDAMHRYSADAVKLGLQERHVRMAELYGAMIATLVAGITRRIDPFLDAPTRKQIPTFVREAMIEMEAMQLPTQPKIDAA